MNLNLQHPGTSAERQSRGRNQLPHCVQLERGHVLSLLHNLSVNPRNWMPARGRRQGQKGRQHLLVYYIFETSAAAQQHARVERTHAFTSWLSHTPNQFCRWRLQRRWRRGGARVGTKVNGPCGPNLHVALWVTDKLLAHYWEQPSQKWWDWVHATRQRVWSRAMNAGNVKRRKDSGGSHKSSAATISGCHRLAKFCGGNPQREFPLSTYHLAEINKSSGRTSAAEIYSENFCLSNCDCFGLSSSGRNSAAEIHIWIDALSLALETPITFEKRSYFSERSSVCWTCWTGISNGLQLYDWTNKNQSGGSTSFACNACNYT